MKPRICALVSTPRSGTHFLRSALDNHKHIEFAGEFFKENTHPSLIKEYIYKGTLDESIVNLDYVGFVWHLVLTSDLEKNSIDKFIILERKNKLEQFVSLLIATKTKSFAYTKTKERIEVDPNHLAHFISRHNNLYSEFRSSLTDYKNIYYEDLCSNFRETIKDIHKYLEVRQDVQEWGESWFRTNGKNFGHSPLVKQETRPMREVVINYEDVKEYDGFYKI